MLRLRTRRLFLTRKSAPDATLVWRPVRLMCIFLILRKANRRWFCIQMNAGIAAAVRMIVPVPGLSNSTGRCRREGIGRTKRTGKFISCSSKLNCGFPTTDLRGNFWIFTDLLELPMRSVKIRMFPRKSAAENPRLKGLIQKSNCEGRRRFSFVLTAAFPRHKKQSELPQYV